MLSDVKLDYDDVLIVPQRTTTASRKDINVEREFKFYHSERVWNGIPIIGSNMFATGSLDMALALHDSKMISCLHKHHTKEDLFQFYENFMDDAEYQGDASIVDKSVNNIWFSMGIKNKDVEKLDSFRFEPNICIDVANGYSANFVGFCSRIREKHPDSIIMAGNVCTPNMVEELILNGGVDIVKIGIGQGSVCTTRLVTGVGYPQLSAVMECAHAAHGLKSDERRLGLICADGGCVHSGDVCKAFCANADFVMLGGMLAGAEECDGEWLYNQEYIEYASSQKTKWLPPNKNANSYYWSPTKNTTKHSLKFYGMSSYEAQKEHNGGVKDYRSSEGREVRVKYKGPVSGVLQEIMGGVRSCCSYIGAKSIKDMGKCSYFIRVNNTHNRSMV